MSKEPYLPNCKLSNKFVTNGTIPGNHLYYFKKW